MPDTMTRKRDDTHRGIQIPFRVDDLRVVEALDAYAAATERSRNGATLYLLKQALAAEGYWPPPEEEPSAETPKRKGGKK
jgi:hypothetical protein